MDNEIERIKHLKVVAQNFMVILFKRWSPISPIYNIRTNDPIPSHFDNAIWDIYAPIYPPIFWGGSTLLAEVIIELLRTMLWSSIPFFKWEMDATRIKAAMKIKVIPI